MQKRARDSARKLPIPPHMIVTNRQGINEAFLFDTFITLNDMMLPILNYIRCFPKKEEALRKIRFGKKYKAER